MNLSALGHIMTLEIGRWDIFLPEFAFEEVASRRVAHDEIEVVRVIRLDA